MEDTQQAWMQGDKHSLLGGARSGWVTSAGRGQSARRPIPSRVSYSLGADETLVLRGMASSLVFSSHPPARGERASLPGEVRARASYLHRPPLLGSTTHRGFHTATPLSTGCFLLMSRRGRGVSQAGSSGAQGSAITWV